LLPHPEGGFYREVFKSSIEIGNNFLPRGFNGSRRLATSIYYLLRAGEISRLHRLKSDELLYFHFGSSLRIVMIDPEGQKHVRFLGPKIEKAEHLQILIPAGTIFGAELTNLGLFSLFSCAVSPGFEFDDFELFEKEDLLQAYPKHTDTIERFT
jgi:predicted cupin superfamily sugar epimerase